MPTTEREESNNASTQPHGLGASPSVAPVGLESLNALSLDAGLVTASFLKYHIRDLIWMKARLNEHHTHIVRCRTLAMRNLASIERALFIEESQEELREAVAFHHNRVSPD